VPQFAIHLLDGRPRSRSMMLILRRILSDRHSPDQDGHHCAVRDRSQPTAQAARSPIPEMPYLSTPLHSTRKALSNACVSAPVEHGIRFGYIGPHGRGATSDSDCSPLISTRPSPAQV